MESKIRPELSQRNRYWIDKHRYYELKHFCLQYPAWKKEYANLIEDGLILSRIEKGNSGNLPGDPTANIALRKTECLERIKMIEKAALDADSTIGCYILKGVTEGLSYNSLSVASTIPCGRDFYYDRYRRFFWLLSRERS